MTTDGAPPLDLARLDRIAATLPPEDAEWLRDLVEPGWRRRQRRDTTVCELLALLRNRGEPSTTAAAHRLVAALRRHLAAADWRAGRELRGGGDPLRALVHRLAVLNDGAPLAWRTVMLIWKSCKET